MGYEVRCKDLVEIGVGRNGDNGRMIGLGSKKEVVGC